MFEDAKGVIKIKRTVNATVKRKGTKGQNVLSQKTAYE
jgi:hypothetical protein